MHKLINFSLSSVDPGDVAADLAHLYGFIHQLRSLRVALPPAPSSVTCSAFDINPFRSLHTLKLDKIQLTQIHGLVSVQQQLKKFTIHRSLHSLKELLIDAVEEKRGATSGMGGAYWSEGTPPPSPTTTEKWRLTATAKLIGSRVVVQPWHRLRTLVLSHNLLTHLDDSLQVLPALKEVWSKYSVYVVPYECDKVRDRLMCDDPLPNPLNGHSLHFYC